MNQYPQRSAWTAGILSHLTTVVILSSLLLVAGCSSFSYARWRKGDLSQYTTPLEPKVVQHICEEFQLQDVRHCQHGRVVYAPDFFPYIKAAFEKGVSTQEDVRAKLGAYEYCEPPSYSYAQDITYIRCRYDLRGDRVFPIGMRYDITDEGIAVLTGIVITIVDD